MTTVTGEYSSLPSQFAAITIADPPEPLPAFAALPSSSSELPGEANGGGRREVADAAPPRKAWRSPPRRVPDQGEVVVMEELGSSWPVPSREGSSNKKKNLPQQPHMEDPSAEGPMGISIAAAAAVAPSSSPESACGGDPDPGSLPIRSPVDPPQEHQKEKGIVTGGLEMQSSDSAAAAVSQTNPLPSRAAGNPRAPRPPLRPMGRQQQGRPPMQNGHRGRNQQHFPGNGGNHQQHRPRHQRNAGFFPHQQPAQVINNSSYRPAAMGFLNPPPEWGFNPGPNLQWGPNPHLAPPRINTLGPSENMFFHGYFPGPYFPDGLPYSAPPLPPILRPPLGQNQPWFMAPLPPLADTTLPSQPINPSLPSEHHQLFPEITQLEVENVSARLCKQIEYYFSDQNLVKDLYLRTCMDGEGWVNVRVIASFPRVQSLTRDVGLILQALQMSPVVEVSVDKMRRKGDWGRWIIQRQQPLSDVNQGEPRRNV